MPRVWLFAALLLPAAVGGCDGCGRNPALASLVERRGDVQRDFSKARDQWQNAEPGAEFRLGDGLRTQVDAKAQLEFVDGSRLDVRSSTTLRFVVDGAADDERSLDVMTGEAMLYAGTKQLRLRTHVGLALINPGSRLLLARLGADLSISLEVGSAQFRNAEGQDVMLAPGESVTLQVGMAVLRRPGDPDDSAKLPLPAAVAAIVASVLHEGVRARERGSQDWRELARGDHDLQPGTGLRLPAGSEVELTRGAERARLLGAGEYVLGSAPTLVEAERGGVRLIAQAGDVEVRVPGGRIVARGADGGSEAELRVDEQSGTLQVKRGSATFGDADGVREVAAGKSYSWTHGAKPAEEGEGEDAAPDYANLEVRAGESFVVHAPQLPVALSFDFAGKCKQRGLLEVAQPKRRSSGVGHANLLFVSGARSYTLRCVDARGTAGRVVARGTAHVLQDAGTRQLPLRAPSSLVDADGRSYTIYYQNQLPELRVRWPNAPKSDNYEFDVDGKTMSVPEPEYVFQSGSLRDGTHRLTFRAQDRRSRTANVEVKFDNTTATASLSAPGDRTFKAGDTVSVEGVVLPAWKVSVQDGTIEKVGADRFQGQVVTSAARPDIAVRLAHPRLGTHYYLRRAADSR